MTGRCLTLTCLPLPQPRGILNLVPPAGVHSASEHVSTGLALKIGSREASFHSPAVATFRATSSPRRGTGGYVVERVCSDVTAFFLHLDRELGGDLLRDGAQRLPGVGLVCRAEGPRDLELTAKLIVWAVNQTASLCETLSVTDQQ